MLFAYLLFLDSMFSVKGQTFGRTDEIKMKEFCLFVILLYTYPHKNIYIWKTINPIKIMLLDSDSTIDFAPEDNI